MMTSLESCLQRGQGAVRRWAARPRVRGILAILSAFISGFSLSAGALAHAAMPLGLGLLLNTGGLPALAMAVGSALGYWLFWGTAGLQGIVWTGLGLPVAWIMGKRRQTPSLVGAIGAFLPSAVGLGFQILLNDDTTIPVYLLRVSSGLGSGVLWSLVREDRLPGIRWVARGVWVLSLSQIAPLGCSLGFPLAGLLTTVGGVPGAALAGLGLDLARVTPVPMTAVLCVCCAIRMIPQVPRWAGAAAPGAVYLLMMGLCGGRDWIPALTLAAGGAAGLLLPRQAPSLGRSDQAGQLQARLEQASAALAVMRRQLLDVDVPPIDEDSLTARVRERACGGCPCRKNCIQRFDPLPEGILHRPMFANAALPMACKKPGRMVMELRRAQEQLRLIRAQRERDMEYRWAVQQQYQFLSQFLQQTAEDLTRPERRLRYRPEVAVCSAGRETANGDRCLWFAGTGQRYYLLLCDGMGTGPGAAQASRTAAGLLRDLLSAGAPPAYALKSINSLLALCGKAGAVTVDLAEVELDTGRAAVYKWGAAASWILRGQQAEKIGTAAPPPGLSVKEGRETVERLSLRRGEVLILLSDGVDGEAALRHTAQAEASSPGELAAKLLEDGCLGKTDDATAAVLRLSPDALAPSYHDSTANPVETQDVG